MLNIHDSNLDIPKGLVKIAFSCVPIVGSTIAELITYLDAKYIERRLTTLEDQVKKLNINLDDFTNRLIALDEDEHKYYVVRSNLKYLCLNALPESIDMLNMALIEIITQDEYGMAEHAAEIIRQLNSEDIAVLHRMKQFILSTKKEYVE